MPAMRPPSQIDRRVTDDAALAAVEAAMDGFTFTHPSHLHRFRRCLLSLAEFSFDVELLDEIAPTLAGLIRDFRFTEERETANQALEVYLQSKNPPRRLSRSDCRRLAPWSRPDIWRPLWRILELHGPLMKRVRFAA